jgi:hypothetical protein
MTGEILTIRAVAELLKINEKTAYKLALAGKILGFKVPRTSTARGQACNVAA